MLPLKHSLERTWDLPKVNHKLKFHGTLSLLGCSWSDELFKNRSKSFESLNPNITVCVPVFTFFQRANMKYNALSVVLVAFLLSTTFLHSVDSSYLRFGRTLSKRKMRARTSKSQVQTDDLLARNKQRETGNGLLGNAYQPLYNW